MKKTIEIVLCVLGVLAMAIGGILYYQAKVRAEGERMMEHLQNGINIGNSLDSTRLLKYKKNPSVTDYEVFWGNPVVTKELFAAVAQAGIKSVRIPVSWDEHIGEDDLIDPAWMNRVAQVVDFALAENLYVILDLHHESWIVPLEENEAEVTERFVHIWTQIAQNFAEKDDHLLFESMNEPRLVDSKDEWTAGTPEMQGVINRLNQAFVETIRNSGGKNKERWLLIPAYCTSGKTDALKALKMPEKEAKVIVAVHAYYPYDFALNKEGTDHFNVEKTKYTGTIDTLKADLKELFISKGIPVVITEFGAVDKDNKHRRLRWMNYYLNSFNELGIPCFWWDNGSDMQLIDRETYEWKYPDLIERLTHWETVEYVE